MKGLQVKANYDIFTLKSTYPSFHTRIKSERIASLHSFSSRFSGNFWLKQEFYRLLGDGMFIRAKVNFCRERLLS